MRDLTITAIIKVYQYDELNEADRALVTTAKEATARSYVPYSHFSVGAAALLGDGTVVSGTNQENAAYPSGLCAERMRFGGFLLFGFQIDDISFH